MFSMTDIINMAVQIEKNAAAIYAGAAKRVKDPVLTATLECLVEDKRRHAGRFGELLVTTPDAGGSAELEALGRAMLRDVIGEQSFSLSEANFWKIKRPEDLLALAVYFEADKQAFYRILQSFAADVQSFDLLESIIDEEADHIDRLQRIIDCRRQGDPIQCDLC